MEINNVLNFYILANKLKTTIIDDKNNYSMADNIFGSMILAMSFDSEYKETKNIAKILRMLFLNGFQKLNFNYSLNENLKKGYKYTNELNELLKYQSKDAFLTLKYYNLDLALTKLIHENGGDYDKLESEALKLINPYYHDDKKSKEIFRFYFQCSLLKNKIRSGWDARHWNVLTERTERISEHIVSSIALALAVDSEFEHDINIDKVIKTLVIHEIGETIIGDITPFDGITPEKKEKIEHLAMRKVLGNLANKNSYFKMLLEFDDGITKEGTFAHYVDKMEADLQCKVYQDLGMHHSLDDQTNNCIFHNQRTPKILKYGVKTAFDIWYEYDKNIYTTNEYLTEFSDILLFIKNHHLIEIKKETNNSLILQKNNSI